MSNQLEYFEVQGIGNGHEEGAQSDYDDDDDDDLFLSDDEIQGLISKKNSAGAGIALDPPSSTYYNMLSRIRRQRSTCFVISLFILFWWVGIYCYHIYFEANPILPTATGTDALAALKPSIQCPSTIPELNENFDETEIMNDYLNNGTQPIVDDDGHNFLATFRSARYDAWGKTYQQVQDRIRPWVRNQFIPHLFNGSTIYESACGIGLNLYLTLEILQQDGHLTDITLYGNDFLPESVAKANTILDLLLESNPSHSSLMKKNYKGSICCGDSTNLSYLGANSFDLVFSGYISPLWDPLELGLGFDDSQKQMRELCAKTISSATDESGNINKIGRLHHAAISPEQDWRNVKLLRIAQERQEVWFSKWVQEMVRIAKPGSPVIVENIGLPFCQTGGDFGGVARHFWVTGAEKYGWDIDTTTVFLSPPADDNRYHVFMQKNSE